MTTQSNPIQAAAEEISVMTQLSGRGFLSQDEIFVILRKHFPHADAIPVPPDEAAVRREFEAWAKTQGLPTPKLKGETYMSHAARWAWQAYLAAARTQD